MKKLHVILLLILVLALWILWWIYFGKNSGWLNWVSKQEIFENDLKCQEKLDEYRNELEAHWYTDIFVFYSPIENSCLWTFKSYKLYDNAVQYNWYSYTIKNLSNLHRNVIFSVFSYYSWDALIKINSMTNTFNGTECSDIDYRDYEIFKDYYDGIERCKFDDAREAYQKELEYLKWN